MLSKLIIMILALRMLKCGKEQRHIGRSLLMFPFVPPWDSRRLSLVKLLFFMFLSFLCWKTLRTASCSQPSVAAGGWVICENLSCFLLSKELPCMWPWKRVSASRCGTISLEILLSLSPPYCPAAYHLHPSNHRLSIFKKSLQTSTRPPV